jgi:hypothetical protein
MKAVVSWFALIAICAAAIPNMVKPEPNGRFKEVVHGADEVVVRTGGNCHRDRASERVVVEITGAEKVAKIIGLFSFTGRYTNASQDTIVSGLKCDGYI